MFRKKAAIFLLNLGITYALNLVFDIVNYFLASGGKSIWDALLYSLKLVLALAVFMLCEERIRSFVEKQYEKN
jgi:hypothetical protein